ncbi:biotin--[acetyl-CoA-carboxylase] ligase [Acidianus sulfidivorans JP7]|uniref:Biotin--[acetyl-CoA-carboxylase] ligase n=1 Tax=Acidianus sulfidivorans JP7 TaxID=619593 RepID=A0A2U9IM28_9CREN|nr:biotin--[acetyl-CoA-carboxylase] ligase [Acidianus sulfidivorans]AWR97060.1 biotin--[acetyl-CoA-carboxylase] ligase [Acidianus sulfidivorans JP7]
MLKFEIPKVTSTQDFAEAIYSHLFCDFLVVAEEQTKARGRYRRSWYSPKGGLWFTYVKKKFNLENIGMATFKVSLAVRESISKYVEAKIRWPNDITVNDRKISGILLEGISNQEESTLFIGIGVNTNVKSFPSDIFGTSIYLETNKEIDNNSLLSSLIDLIDNYLNLDDKKTIELMNKYSSIKDRKVKIITINNEEKICVGMFVDNYGRLVTDCGIFEVEDVLRLETQ